MANEFKIKKGLIVHGSGSSGDETVLDVQGNEGQLFSVTDQLSGSLFSVNDISGLPVLEAFSDDKVIMGSYGQNTLVVTGSKVGIGTDDPSEALHVEHGNIEIAAAAASAQGLYFSEGGNQKWSLYNLKEDPLEQNDLARIKNEKLKEMIVLWHAYKDQNGVIIDNDMRLGYSGSNSHYDY